MASMSEFRGFSDREIQRSQERGRVRVATLQHTALSRQQLPASRMTTARAATSSRELPTSAYFAAAAERTTKELDQTVQKTAIGRDGGPQEDQARDQPAGVSTFPATQESCEETNLPDLHMDNQSAVVANLEQLQRQQRELELENKKKKALLEQTLQERYAKSEMEARRLAEVKESLAKLDSLLNRDVAILRAKIEEANRHYTAARKRYETAEAEFVAAKLALHKTTESKELLSEHLCTIIQQNEVRKSEKLAELLKTLKTEGQEIAESDTTGSSHALEHHTLYRKTPTPGASIWPRDRLGSKENSLLRREGDHPAIRDVVTAAENVESTATAEPQCQPDSVECSVNEEPGQLTPKNIQTDQNPPLIQF